MRDKGTNRLRVAPAACPTALVQAVRANLDAHLHALAGLSQLERGDNSAMFPDSANADAFELLARFDNGEDVASESAYLVVVSLLLVERKLLSLLLSRVPQSLKAQVHRLTRSVSAERARAARVGRPSRKVKEWVDHGRRLRQQHREWSLRAIAVHIAKHDLNEHPVGDQEKERLIGKIRQALRRNGVE